MFVLVDKTELETAQQFLDQASQQNLVYINAYYILSILHLALILFIG